MKKKDEITFTRIDKNNQVHGFIRIPKKDTETGLVKTEVVKAEVKKANPNIKDLTEEGCLRIKIKKFVETDDDKALEIYTVQDPEALYKEAVRIGASKIQAHIVQKYHLNPEKVFRKHHELKLIVDGYSKGEITPLFSNPSLRPHAIAILKKHPEYFSKLGEDPKFTKGELRDLLDSWTRKKFKDEKAADAKTAPYHQIMPLMISQRINGFWSLFEAQRTQAVKDYVSDLPNIIKGRIYQQGLLNQPKDLKLAIQAYIKIVNPLSIDAKDLGCSVAVYYAKNRLSIKHGVPGERSYLHPSGNGWDLYGMSRAIGKIYIEPTTGNLIDGLQHSINQTNYNKLLDEFVEKYTSFCDGIRDYIEAQHSLAYIYLETGDSHAKKCFEDLLSFVDKCLRNDMPLDINIHAIREEVCQKLIDLGRPEASLPRDPTLTPEPAPQASPQVEKGPPSMSMS